MVYNALNHFNEICHNLLHTQLNCMRSTFSETHPSILGLTLEPKLTYSTHILNISVHAYTPLQIIKALTQQDGGNIRRHS